MNNEIILSPEELYFLGKLFQAKYIDYSYIAAMKDISNNYSVFEKETQSALVSSGVLMEDFSGNIEIDARLTEVLNPVFFGEFESSIHDYIPGDETTFNVVKFHSYDEAITMVTHSNDKFVFKKVDVLEIKDIITKLLPDGYSCEDTIAEEFKGENISRLIVFKNITAGTSGVNLNFFYQEDKLYMEIEGQRFSTVSRETFEKLGCFMIKGA
jgi:hypothetical protein